MAHHVAIAYPDHSRTTEAIAALKRLEAKGVVELKKIAAITVEGDRGFRPAHILGHTAIGTLAGAVVGVLIGLMFSELMWGTIMGTAVGTLAGVMIGFSRTDEPENYGFGPFGEYVATSVAPGTSALLMLVEKRDPAATIAELQQFGGRVIRTTLPNDIETQLKSAVHQQAAPAAA